MGQGARPPVTRKLRYLKSYRDRHGIERHYFRKPGYPAVALPGKHGSRAFMEAYWKLREGGALRDDRGIEREAAGSLSALIARYYKTTSYKTLNAKTKASYRGDLERLREAYGKLPVAGLKRKHIAAMLDELSGKPGAEYNRRRVLRRVLETAVDLGWIPFSPMQGMRRKRGYGGGFADWSEDEIATFEKHWPLGTKPRLAFDLLLYTAQRRGDVVTMGRQHMKDGAIHVAQAKSGGRTRLWIPIHRNLSASLATVPGDQLAFLLTQHGKPYTAAGFGNWFGEAVRAAGIENRTAHGLRKAGLRRLAEAGCTPHQLKAISGHKNLSEVTLYTEAADQARLAVEAIARVEAGTKVSTLRKPLGKTGKKA